MGGRFVRARLGVALATLAVALVAAPASGADCDAHHLLDDEWTKIDAPSFVDGPATMSGYDVAHNDPGHLVVTNGTSISTSTDGGCEWTQATLPDLGPLADIRQGEGAVLSASVTQVRMPSFPYRTSTVWALGQSDVVAPELLTAQPRVLYSDDGGMTFEMRVSGLPEFGRPIAVRDAGTMTLLLFRTTFPADEYAIFRSTDEGMSWDKVLTSASALSDFVVDPFTAQIWAWSDGGLFTHTTGGALQAVPDVTGSVSAVDAVHGEVTVYITAGTERFVSVDAGRTFTLKPSPLDVKSVTRHYGLEGLRATSSTLTNVLVEPPLNVSTQPLDYSPRDGNVSTAKFVSVVEPEGFPIYAFNSGALYRRHIPLSFALPPPPPEPPPIDVKIRDPKPPRLEKASITPANEVVSLRPGQRTTVNYAVALPAAPTPLDVYFMTDSTGSMQDTIAGVQVGIQEIIDGLASTGIDVQFGVADFRDYKQTPADANYPYKRHREIGPLDSDLEDALGGLRTGGGTTDGDDSALEAVYQAVTGAGRTDLLGDELIPPGLGAEFREGAMKVVVLASDDDMRKPGGANATYPGPSLDTVKDVLQDNGVYFVGLEVHTSNGGDPREDMETLARASGAVAPAKGVDCDGDAQPDVHAGDPMVCDFDANGGDTVADAFVAMLSGIEDLADVDLTLAGPAKYVRAAAPLHHADVDMKDENHFTLPVKFVCNTENAGTESPVRIAARSRDRELVSTTATFRCIAPDPPEVPPGLPPLVAVALVPPPPPPPAPITNVQPNVNPNVNPNPQINPNTGFAAQDEQEFQLATVENQVPDPDLAFSALDRPVPPTPVLAWAAALAMTSAAAFGLKVSRRTAPAPAFNPREYR